MSQFAEDAERIAKVYLEEGNDKAAAMLNKVSADKKLALWEGLALKDEVLKQVKAAQA